MYTVKLVNLKRATIRAGSVVQYSSIPVHMTLKIDSFIMFRIILLRSARTLKNNVILDFPNFAGLFLSFSMKQFLIFSLPVILAGDTRIDTKTHRAYFGLGSGLQSPPSSF